MYTIKRVDKLGTSYIYRDIPTKKHAQLMIKKIISELPSAFNKYTVEKQYRIVKQIN